MSPPCRQSEALWRTSREYNARYYRVVIMAATANKRVRRPIFRHWSLYNRFLPCFFPPPVFLLFISYPCSRFLRFVSRFIPRFLPFLIFCHSFSGIIHFSRSYPRRFISKLRCNRSNSKDSWGTNETWGITYRRFANLCKFSSSFSFLSFSFYTLFKECSKY